MSNYCISAGKIITLAQIISISRDFEDVGIELKEINDILLSSGSLGGTVPIKDSIRIGYDFEFLIIKERKIQFSEYTKEFLLPFSEGINPSNLFLQKILYKILQKKHYQWIIHFSRNIALFKNYIPDNWVDLLETAGLFNLSDNKVLDWWTSIIKDINQIEFNREKDIGNLGEFFTFNFEVNRISNDGFPNYLNHVIWVSKISDMFGFDIKSICGALLFDGNDYCNPIRIEVKASVVTSVNSFRMKISRNEWETALENPNLYFFYCWTGIEVEKNTYQQGPFIVPALKMINFLPKDKNEFYKWTECTAFIDLEKMKIN
jgi:hypothetical protein